MICSSCGFSNQDAARFCGGCGAPLVSDSSMASQAERRVLSVLFCDIVGATTLSEQIDPEDLRDLLRDYHHVCSQAVDQYDGFLADLLGDGVVIYFGYPRAHEDDEIRAVRCALTIQQSVSALCLKVRYPFQVRIGVHRGRVVVGALGGASGVQSLAIGETPNIAARLQSEARPGEVVVSDSLWRLIARAFHGEALGARRLKGIQRPIEIHRILDHRSDVQNRGLAVCFVGRQAELERIRSSFVATLEGRPQAVLIRGEPGIGKSRLVQQICSDLEETSNLTVLESFCSPFTTDTPFFPLTELLRHRLSLSGLQPAEQFEQLAKSVANLGLPQQEALPLFALFLSIEFDPTSWAVLTDLSLARQRQRTLDFLFQALTALSSEAPVVLIIEDLHWVDPSTLEFLDQLLSHSIHGRFLVILTARLQFRSRWKEHPKVSEIQLEALVADQAEDLIRTVASDKAMPPELVRQICVRADGNPLFLEEITASVISSSSVVEREHTWELVQPFSADVVPVSMEAALMARLDQAGEAKAILQIGATLGREFNLDLLTAVVSLEPAKVELSLLQMVDQGFLRITGSSPPVYIFKHALVQDVAYHSLMRSTRQQHHARIAIVMAEQFPELSRQRPELIAHHLSGAGNYAEAAVHWQAAGQIAAERNAVNEAVEHLSRGLLDLEHLPDADNRWQSELALQTALAPLQMAAYGWASPRVETTCKRAIDLAVRLGADDSLFAPLWGLWSNQFVGGRLGPAIETAYKVFDLATRSDHSMYIMAACNATSYTHFFRSEFSDAIQHANTGIASYDFQLESRLCRVFQLAPITPIMTAKACSLWMRGKQREGYDCIQVMRERSSLFGHTPTLVAGLAFLCHFLFNANDWQALFSISQKVVDLATAEGFSMWRACSEMYRAHAALTLGLPGITTLDVIESAEIFRQTNSLCIDPATSFIISSALHSDGRSTEALEENEAGQRTAECNQVGAFYPEIIRLRAEILSDLGRPQEAHEAYRQAIRAARSQDAASLELRALHSYLLRCTDNEYAVDIVSQLRSSLGIFDVNDDLPEVSAIRKHLSHLIS